MAATRVCVPEDAATIVLPGFGPEIRAAVPDLEHYFDEFLRELDRYRRRFLKLRRAAHYEEKVFRGTGLVVARRQVAHLLTANALRVLDLGAGVVLLLDTRRAHASYVAARALVESCAVAAYVEQEVVTRVRKNRVEQGDTLIHRLHMGVDPGVGFESDPPAPVPVGSLIKALCAQADSSSPSEDAPPTVGATLRSRYSLLSDHAHPNFGAQHLSTRFTEDGFMDWRFDIAWTDALIIDVLGTSLLAMKVAGDSYDRALRPSGDIASC